eukprot:scaffold65435_cov45-Phaeocystis_antarctica.AAC.1
MVEGELDQPRVHRFVVAQVCARAGVRDEGQQVLRRGAANLALAHAEVAALFLALVAATEGHVELIAGDVVHEQRVEHLHPHRARRVVEPRHVACQVAHGHRLEGGVLLLVPPGPQLVEEGGADEQPR